MQPNTGVLRNNCSEKDASPATLLKKEKHCWCLSVIFIKIFQNTFFPEHLQLTASVL